ncbi:MAG: glutathione-dependent formaldehyde dehydrogenase [Acidobacteria bacterium]|nr:MAG: glutathione-dependent formaldehyde dehydrogenase [Acidobacteriota bacterium]
MKAVCWMGIEKMKVETVPDPQILNPRDAIVRITSTCICGSDLHLYNGLIPTMEQGDIMGHEFMGEVVEVGAAVNKDKLKVGDRVVVPFTIACGRCFFCERQLWSCCDNSNPNYWIAEQLMGYSPSGLFGYTHMMGGYAGGQAQYARVPYADVGPLKIPADISDEKVVFLSDIFPTGYFGALNCNIEPGDTIAIWGCGPVAQFAIRSAFMLGAERVIAIDRFDYRLRMAEAGGAETINYEEVDDVVQTLKDMTANIGPDACIDAVGMEAHGDGVMYAVDLAKQAMKVENDRPIVLRQCIQACRKGGTVSVPGVYSGFDDHIPMGAFMNKGLTMKTGQTHMMRFMQPLLDRIQKGEIDPSFVRSHRVPIDRAPEMYKIFRDKQDNCTKVVLDPWDRAQAA